MGKEECNDIKLESAALQAPGVLQKFVLFDKVLCEFGPRGRIQAGFAGCGTSWKNISSLSGNPMFTHRCQVMMQSHGLQTLLKEI